MQYQPAHPVFTCSCCLQGGPALQVAQVAKPIKMMHKVQQKVSSPDGCPGQSLLPLISMEPAKVVIGIHIAIGQQLASCVAATSVVDEAL